MSCKNQGDLMATMSYYVALAFKRSEDNGEVVACGPKELRSADQAIRMAGSLAAQEGHCGAIAFSRTGDPALEGPRPGGDRRDAPLLRAARSVQAWA